MKKKFLGMLGAMCMALVLMPMTVKADSPEDIVFIGGVELNETNCYYHNGENGAIGTADGNAEGASASFNATTGTLTLNGLHIESAEKGIYWELDTTSTAKHQLIIELVENSTNIVTSTTDYAIYGFNGWVTGRGTSVKIGGKGNLIATGKTGGIFAWNSVTIQDGANVTAHSETTGVEAKDNFGGVIVIKGGTLTASGDVAAFHSNPTLDSNEGWKVDVGEASNSTVAWDNTTGLGTYKYVKIECLSLKGTATISGTAKYGETLTATLENTNNTGTLTYTWEAGGNVLQQGAENTYTISSTDVIGKTITVKVSGSDHVGSVVSQPTATVEKLDASSTPSNLQGVKPSTAGGADGKITGTDTSMEYSTTTDFATKTTCTATETTGLAAGTYYVRFAENTTTKASNYVTVTVPEGDTAQSGTVENDTNKETNECKAELEESSTDLTGKVLTTEDQQKITAGKDVKIWLEVTTGENKATDTDKTLTQAKLDGYTLGKYLDLILWKQFDGETASKVTATSGTVTVKFTVPQELINTDSNKTRAYRIIRVHDDGTGAKAEVIPCSYTAADKTISFETDKFSIYSLTYKDTVTNTGTGNNNSSDDDDDDNSNNTSVAEADQWDDVPKTGENDAIGWLLGMAAVAAVGAIYTGRKQKEL